MRQRTVLVIAHRLTTVRDADDHSYRVITIGDCCAAATRELHDTVLLSMNMRRMRVKDSSEVIAMLEASGRRG